MKYCVKIAEQTYEVEISDLRARPIIAMVDGEEFQIWPEAGTVGGESNQTQTEVRQQISPTPSGTELTIPSGLRPKTMRAPIPGVIVTVTVKSGDEVAIGNELCVLEAMKMKNTIRAGRAGRIATVHVSVGQTVNHNDPLVEFEE